MKILNFGSLNLDYVYQVDHFVKPGETLSAIEQSVHPGGKGLNQSIALSRAGAEVYHAGCLGKGVDMLEQFLRENGVHTDFLQKTDTLQGNAVIQVNREGQNCILLFGGSNRCVTPAQVESTLSHFDCGDFLVLQNEISELPHIIDAARARGMKILLNPSPYDSAVENCDLSRISVFLLNEIEGGQISGEKEPGKILEKLTERFPEAEIVLTLGSEGSIYKHKDWEFHQGIYKVKAVDTTAAGDTFTGYFISCLINGMEVQKSLDIAAKASSIAVTRPGATDSIPLREEVLG